MHHFNQFFSLYLMSPNRRRRYQLSFAYVIYATIMLLFTGTFFVETLAVPFIFKYHDVRIRRKEKSQFKTPIV